MSAAIRLRKLLLVHGTWRWNAFVRDVTAKLERMLFLCLLLALVLPRAAFAQDQAGVTDNLPQSTTFWTLVISVLTSPFLAKAISLLADLVIAWGRAKKVKHIDTYAYLYNLARNVVAEIDADIQAMRIKFIAADSDGGVIITKAEAAQLQTLAVQSLKQRLGHLDFGKIAADLGITVDSIEGVLKGLIQHAFDDKKAKEQLAQPSQLDPAAAALLKAGLVPRDPATAAAIVSPG